MPSRPDLPLVDPQLVAAIASADAAIRPSVLETPVVEWPQYSEHTGGPVWVKAEHLQRTGSFKLRGATNAVMRAIPRGLTIATASSGNHGIAVSHALRAAGKPGVVFLPETVSPSKLEAVRRSGVRVELFGRDSHDTEVEAQRVSAIEGWHYLSPYNDPDVIAGQGTIGLELLRQLSQIDVVYVSVGGGGLISGVAAALKARNPDIHIVGCSPANSCVMHESVRAGRMLELESLPTFSDGTAGGVDADAITFDYCRTLVDEWLLVSEQEIARSMRDHIDHLHQLVEGSAGVAFAALLQHAKSDARFRGATRVAISCGQNIGAPRLLEVLAASG
ncbi:MAG: pyridoxal-phosphate dependent enzyme [Gemmatimonadaceae bacterium]|nr:pyridoxal-phosphate dependent enzyme [Gemmatimonadaceae bacterium]